MYDAWTKGISTHEFRKCLTEDLNFISEFKGTLETLAKEKLDKMEQETRIKNALATVMKRG